MVELGTSFGTKTYARNVGKESYQATPGLTNNTDELSSRHHNTQYIYGPHTSPGIKLDSCITNSKCRNVGIFESNKMKSQEIRHEVMNNSFRSPHPNYVSSLPWEDNKPTFDHSYNAGAVWDTSMPSNVVSGSARLPPFGSSPYSVQNRKGPLSNTGPPVYESQPYNKDEHYTHPMTHIQSPWSSAPSLAIGLGSEHLLRNGVRVGPSYNYPEMTNERELSLNRDEDDSYKGMRPDVENVYFQEAVNIRDSFGNIWDKDDGKEKMRGCYRCGRCGAPKRGHICPYQPRYKRRSDDPVPEMRNMSTQVEMDEYLVLRRLNLEIQGYPETYSSILNMDNVGTEVRYPNPNLPLIDQEVECSAGFLR